MAFCKKAAFWKDRHFIKGDVLQRARFTEAFFLRFFRGMCWIFAGCLRGMCWIFSGMCRLFIGACQAFVKYAPDIRLTFD